MTHHSRWSTVRHVKVRAARRYTPMPAAGADPGGRADSAGAAAALQGHRVRYEGYGPGGAALLIACETNDRDRTRAALRQAFSDHGGSLGAAGSVSYLFNPVGLMTYPPGTDRQQLLRAALEAGAEDVVPHADRSIEVLADPMEFETVRARLTRHGFAPKVAELTERAAVTALLAGESARQMVQLLEVLEDLDDVRDVYSNVEISDEVLAHL